MQVRGSQMFNGIEFGYLLAFVLIGSAFWLSGYVMQRKYRNALRYESKQKYVQLQTWLALLLFGNPMGNGWVEKSEAIYQLIGWYCLIAPGLRLLAQPRCATPISRPCLLFLLIDISPHRFKAKVSTNVTPDP
jgi:heme A synthase